MAADPTPPDAPPPRSPQGRRRSSVAAWVVVLALVVGFAFMAYRLLLAGADAGRGLPAYSVYSGDANGLAETANVLSRLGWQPTALTRPVQQTRARGLLILTEPRAPGPLGVPGPDLSATDVYGLLDWVSKGNTLLLVGRVRTGVHVRLAVALSAAKALDAAARRVTEIEFSGYTEGVEELEVEGRTIIDSAPAGVPLWWVGDRPGAVVVGHGQGRVVVVADPSLLTHRGLLRGDNVVFLYNVAAHAARDGVVYFDEYHHGIRAGGGYWSYLHYHNQHWAILQLLAVGAVAAWSMAVRLGPPVPLPPASAADAVDYASAVARIYERAGVRHLLADLVVRDFLEALARLLHLKRAAPPGEILAAWRIRYPGTESCERLRWLLHGTAELREAAARKEHIPERRLLMWARAFDQFVEEHRKIV